MTARPVQELFDLDGRTALVTLGSRGLGLQIAHALGEAGARVVVSARHSSELEAAVDELKSAHVDASWVAANCAVEEQARQLVDETLERVGDIDILVNNAGAAWAEPAEEHSLEGWDKVMDVNVRGYFILAQRVARLSMIPRTSGRIINVSSVAGLRGNPPEMRTLAYNTSKAAVIGFTQTLAGEWGRYHINVNAICPGFFKTKLSTFTIQSLGEEALVAHSPLGRLGDDEDLKGAVLLFASDAGKHITGQALAVDGGVSAVLSF